MRAPYFASSRYLVRRSLRAARRHCSATLLALLALHGLAPRAHAICRVVEPSVDSGAAGVAFDQTTAALFVAAPEVVVDWHCPTPDVSLGPDAASALDAASDPDAAVDFDAGAADAAIGSDAGPSRDASADAWLDAMPMRDPNAPPVCPDGSLALPVLGPIVSLVVQPRVLQRAGDAGLVMPVPARPDVAQGPANLFAAIRIAANAAANGSVHETVTVVEDSALGLQCTDPHYTVDAADVLLAAPAALYGCSASADPYYRAGTAYRDAGIVYYGDSSVIEEAIPVSDEYTAVALSASDAGALSAWLDDHHFAHSAVDDAAFAAYVGPGRWFVALHVHPRPPVGTTPASTDLRPLVVSWQGTELPIANRLQFDPRGGSLVTDAFVLAPERRDAADGSAVTLSASVAPSDPMLAGFGVRGGWLTHLRLGRDQARELPDSALVPTSNAPMSAPSIERRTTVHIPSPCCPSGLAADRSHPRTFMHERTYAMTPTPPALPETWLRTSLDPSSAICMQYASYGSGCGGGGTSSGGRPLRGCTVSHPQWPTFAPLALVIAWLWSRGRRRR